MKILAPTDLSPISIKGLAFAAALAEHLLMDLELLYVINQPFMLNSGTLNAKKLDSVLHYDGTQELNSIVESIKKKHPKLKSIKYHISHAPKIDAEICQFAQSSECDMVIMSTHGRTGLETLLMGSVTLSVVNKCLIPVIAVPINSVYSPIKTITLPSNISDIEYQLNTIIPFALFFNAYLNIVHVSKQMQEQTNEIELEFKKIIDAQLYPKINYHLIKNDNISDGIISYITKNKSDMIVFFTHELSLYEKIYNLGITKKVIPFLQLPALIIKNI